MKNPCRWLLKTLCLVALIALPQSASAVPFETIMNNGDSQNRVDIAIVGDGYTAAEMAKYRADVQQFIGAVFAQEPYKEYQRYFNVRRLDVTSNQSGADHPPVFRDTAFNSTYNCGGIQRLICADTSAVLNMMTSTLTPTQYDIKLVIVNDPEYGGSGGSLAVASTHAAAVELILHEIGHSFGLLADEYGGPAPPNCNATVEPPEANATRQTARASIKWNGWIDPSTPLPTDSTTPGVPGIYQGSKYCDFGLYRPTNLSKMRALGAPFEQINVEQHIRRVYNFTSPVDSFSPSQTSLQIPIGLLQLFQITTPAPLTHTLSVKWFVNNQLKGEGAQFTLDTGLLTSGVSHTVTAQVEDTTGMVRRDTEQLLKESVTWTVSVTGSLPPKVSINNVTLAEGNLGTTNATFTVSLSRASEQPVSVKYATANGTANSLTDYLTKTGTLSFLAGETTKTFAVPVKGDLSDEANETFNVNLTNPVGATILDGQGTGTITDNDPLPVIRISDVNVTEGNIGAVNAVFNVTLSAASGRTVTVQYATANGTANSLTDYLPKTGTLIFAPGQTTKTIIVPVKGDTLREANETFFVNLTAPTNATRPDAQARCVIFNGADFAAQPAP